MAHALSSSPIHFSFRQFVRNSLHNLSEAATKRRAYQQTCRELHALDDAMLADLGLTRSGINRAALDASIGSSRH